jgi:hypothetical protein
MLKPASLLLLMMLLSQPLLSQDNKKLQKTIDKHLKGIEIVVEQDFSIPKKFNWDDLNTKIKAANINIKKIVFTNKDAFEFRYVYSSSIPSFDSDIYLNVTEHKTLPSDDLIAVIGYVETFKNIIKAPDWDSLKSELSYVAGGDKTCMDLNLAASTKDGAEVKNDSFASIYVGDIDMSAIKEIKQLQQKEGAIYEVKNFLMVGELNSSAEVLSKVKEIVGNKDKTDEQKIKDIKAVLVEKEIYKGELKNFIEDMRGEDSRIVKRISSIIDRTLDDYGGIQIPKDIFETLNYYELPRAFTCLIQKIRENKIETITVNMSNKDKTDYDKDKKALHVNIEDLFSFKL